MWNATVCSVTIPCMLWVFALLCKLPALCVCLLMFPRMSRMALAWLTPVCTCLTGSTISEACEMTCLDGGLYRGHLRSFRSNFKRFTINSLYPICPKWGSSSVSMRCAEDRQWAYDIFQTIVSFFSLTRKLSGVFLWSSSDQDIFFSSLDLSGVCWESAIGIPSALLIVSCTGLSVRL